MISDVLRNAAQLITAKGWCQGISEDCHGRLCAIGAICRVTESLHQASFVEGILQAFLNSGQSVSNWNDTHGRTEQEVLRAFLDCAESFEPRLEKADDPFAAVPKVAPVQQLKEMAPC